MSPHPEIQRVTENNCPLERINPLGKALYYHEKVYWKQQCFHRKSQNTCCKALLKWECSFKCRWLWWGGEAWSLPGAFAFLLSSFVQCLKYSLRHWKPLHSVSENTWFSSQFWAAHFRMDQGSIWKHKMCGDKAESILSSTAHRL